MRRQTNLLCLFDMLVVRLGSILKYVLNIEYWLSYTSRDTEGEDFDWNRVIGGVIFFKKKINKIPNIGTIKHLKSGCILKIEETHYYYWENLGKLKLDLQKQSFIHDLSFCRASILYSHLSIDEITLGETKIFFWFPDSLSKMSSIFYYTNACSVLLLAQSFLANEITTARAKITKSFSANTGKFEDDQSFEGIHNVKTSIVNGMPSRLFTRVSP